MVLLHLIGFRWVLSRCRSATNCPVLASQALQAFLLRGPLCRSAALASMAASNGRFHGNAGCRGFEAHDLRVGPEGARG